MFSMKVQHCLLSWKLRTERFEKGKECCSLSKEVWYWDAGGLADCSSALLMPFAGARVCGAHLVTAGGPSGWRVNSQLDCTLRLETETSAENQVRHLLLIYVYDLHVEVC